MNTHIQLFKRLIPAAAGFVFLAACSAALTKPDGADDARTKLTKLQSDPQLASLAPVAIKEAEAAVVAAEVPREDTDLARHLVVIADRKVDIATAQAESKLLEDQRKLLSEQREAARLESRTLEVDRARGDATVARTEAEIARSQAETARMDALAARQQTADLQRQITELNARETDRGLVVTLGDVLFATGKSDLKGGVTSNLGKLAAFLTKYPDRTVLIEGHTDDVGSDDSNMSLSERRARSVMTYLIEQGVAANRLAASGMGESAPVSGNDTSTGRQQNRRVEVIIANTVTSAS
ncbi:MAG: OmpA family protein [Panacagrimonas sp.]